MLNRDRHVNFARRFFLTDIFARCHSIVFFRQSLGTECLMLSFCRRQAFVSALKVGRVNHNVGIINSYDYKVSILVIIVLLHK